MTVRPDYATMRLAKLPVSRGVRNCLAVMMVSLVACTSESPRAADTIVAANRVARPDVPLSQGEGRLPVDGGHIWYRVTGADTGTPVVLVHGGPGLSSYYLKSLEALGDQRAVVRYDQLGSGKSDALADTSKMNMAHFVSELEALRAHLGYKAMHVLGHGWGAAVALEYYRAHPEHVTSLTLASAFLDAPAWSAREQQLLHMLPDSMQQAVAAAIQTGEYSSPEYLAAVTEFYARFVWLHPVTADLDSIGQSLDPAVSDYLQGRGDFIVSGTLRDYSAVSYLHEIAVPTLYTVGQVDMAGVVNVRRFAGLTPHAQTVVIPGAAYMTMWDNPAAMLAAVRLHLATADAAQRPFSAQ